MRFPAKYLRLAFLISLILSALIYPSAWAEEKSPLKLLHSDTYEYIRGLLRDTIFITGSVAFEHGATALQADTAIWIKGQSIILHDHVYVEDSLYMLSADWLEYNINPAIARAYGDTVILISKADSLMAVGDNAYFCRDSSIFRMHHSPMIYLNYQDTGRITQINADSITLNTAEKIAYAYGQVIISQLETECRSDRAVMYLDDEVLLLLENPVAQRKKSKITGDTLILIAEDRKLNQINAFGNAFGDFREPTEKDSTLYDNFELKASEIRFDLEDQILRRVTAANQAYSFYPVSYTHLRAHET